MAFRLYLDEDSMNRAMSRALTARGMDVTNALDSGMAARSDSDQLEFARTEQRVLYTFNIGDFFRLHTEWIEAGRSHAGLILVPQRRFTIGVQMRRILRMNQELSTDAMRDRAEFLTGWD